MKNILILLITVLLTSVELMAQSVPEGMRFQAIARSIDGDLLREQPLTVQVELLSVATAEKVHYTETHEVRSSNLGLLDFIIGEGNVLTGSFSGIPWMSSEMWVRISVKAEKDDHFQIISSGQLYSVPYAIYATRAGELRSGERTPGLGMNSINWTLEGNSNSQERNNGNPVLGTTDANDLVIITNKIPRIVIDQNGMINFMVAVDINGDLNVDGATTLNGSLVVTNMAATHLTGTLTVDKATTLNDVLNVNNMSATHLTGSLDVDKTLNADGATTMNSSLTVTGAKASNLTGTLEVDGVTTLNDDLTVQNSSPTMLTGTLDVDGPMNNDGAATLNSTLTVTGMNASSLGGTLTVTKETTLNDDLTVANSAPTHLTGTLDVDGDIAVGGSTIDGPLTIDGMNPSTLTGTLDVDKLATLEAGLQMNGGGAVGPGNSHMAFFDNSEGGTSDGIAVKLANEQVDKNNNFMTFYRGTSSVAGRIEGYTIGDLDDIPEPTSDEIWTAVCIGIADYNPITIAWTQMASGFNLIAAGWNGTTIPSFDIPDIPAFTIPDVPALAIPDVPAFVIPDVPGFVIPDIPGVVIPDVPELIIGPYLCAEVCICPCLDFSWTCCCAEVCLIPEMTLFPGITLPDFPGIAIPDFPGIPIPDFPGIPVPDFPGVAIPDFPGLVIPAVPELDLSAVFGTCPTIPTFSDILVDQGICPDEDIFNLNNGYIRRLADWALEHRLQGLVTADPLRLVGNAIAWGLTTAVLENGTVYGSKGADYAEYLPKLYETEQFMKGEVVGVHNGKISKNTTNADQILAITSQPLVLGNLPESGDTDDFEKIAFLGQIPVYVEGPVKVGDYIIPSGMNNGVAKAVGADGITTQNLSMVLGTAWSSYDNEGITLINTSIGLRPMEIAEILKRQGNLEDELHQQVQVQRSNSDLLSSDIEEMKRAVGLTKAKFNP